MLSVVWLSCSSDGVSPNLMRVFWSNVKTIDLKETVVKIYQPVWTPQGPRKGRSMHMKHNCKSRMYLWKDTRVYRWWTWLKVGRPTALSRLDCVLLVGLSNCMQTFSMYRSDVNSRLSPTNRDWNYKCQNNNNKNAFHQLVLINKLNFETENPMENTRFKLLNIQSHNNKTL